MSILSEESAATQLMVRNGVQKSVRIVSKTTPFIMEVYFPQLALHEYNFSVGLFYDGDDEVNLRPVDGVRNEPLTFKIHLSGSGDRATVTCKISVLTSQHDEALFRVRVTAISNKDPELIVSVLSSPLWVVSKTSQAVKLGSQTSKPVFVAPPPIPVTVGAKRNSSGDFVLEALERLEKQQLEQQKTINFLLGSRIPDPLDMDFEEAFQRFIGAYTRLPTNERASKLKKISFNTDFTDMCSSVVRDLSFPSEISTSSGICCGEENCSHKRELDSMHQFYEEFIYSPDSTPEI